MRRLIALSSIAILGGLSACTNAGEHSTDNAQIEQKTELVVITGKLAYRERIALHPGYTMTVTLSDISVADRSAPVIAKMSRTLRTEQVPLSFELSAEKSVLKARNRYAVRGILTDTTGNLVWTTDTTYLIDPSRSEQDLGTLMMVAAARSDGPKLLPAGEDKTNSYMCGETLVKANHSSSGQDLILSLEGKRYTLPSVVSASGAKYEKDDQRGRVMFWSKGDKATLSINGKTYPECSRGEGGASTSLLSDTQWRVEDVANGGVIDRTNLTLKFGADGRLSGSSGCNRYTTEYSLSGEDKISVKPVAGTRMACAPALMDLEQKFLSVLGDADSYTLSDEGALLITSKDGRTLRAMKASQ